MVTRSAKKKKKPALVEGAKNGREGITKLTEVRISKRNNKGKRPSTELNQDTAERCPPEKVTQNRAPLKKKIAAIAAPLNNKRARVKAKKQSTTDNPKESETGKVSTETIQVELTQLNLDIVNDEPIAASAVSAGLSQLSHAVELIEQSGVTHEPQPSDGLSTKKKRGGSNEQIPIQVLTVAAARFQDIPERLHPHDKEQRFMTRPSICSVLAEEMRDLPDEVKLQNKPSEFDRDTWIAFYDADGTTWNSRIWKTLQSKFKKRMAELCPPRGATGKARKRKTTDEVFDLSDSQFEDLKALYELNADSLHSECFTKSSLPVPPSHAPLQDAALISVNEADLRKMKLNELKERARRFSDIKTTQNKGGLVIDLLKKIQKKTSDSTASSSIMTPGITSLSTPATQREPEMSPTESPSLNDECRGNGSILPSIGPLPSDSDFSEMSGDAEGVEDSEGEEDSDEGTSGVSSNQFCPTPRPKKTVQVPVVRTSRKQAAAEKKRAEDAKKLKAETALIDIANAMKDNGKNMTAISSSFAAEIGRVTASDHIDTSIIQSARDLLDGSLIVVAHALREHSSIDAQNQLSGYEQYASLMEEGRIALLNPNCDDHGRWLIASDAIKRKNGNGKQIWIEMERAFPGKLPKCFTTEVFDASSFFQSAAPLST